MTQTQTSRFIPASPEAVDRACTNPEALAAWRVPDGMKAQIHAFDAGVGGGYRMSLFYLGPEADGRGKTTTREDRFTARFLELTPAIRGFEY